MSMLPELQIATTALHFRRIDRDTDIRTGQLADLTATGINGDGFGGILHVTAPEPLADLREAIAAARTEAGGLLAGFRHTAGLSQVQLAGQIGYSATVVAHAELGRRPVSAEFWELADGALGAGGSLTAWGTRIKGLIRGMHEEQRCLERARHAGRLSQLLAQPGADDMAAAVPDAREPAITTPTIGRCPHCRQPVTLVTQIAAPPETGAGPAPPS